MTRSPEKGVRRASTRTSKPGRSTSPEDVIACFLRNLRATGLRGSEGLIAHLLEGVTGQAFRLCGSGFQHGLDAGTETATANVIAVESKRYDRKTLSLRELQSELSQASSANPDLDLWVLAVSRSVPKQVADGLRHAAANAGIETLILDLGTGGLPRLAVLLAAYPETVKSWADQHGHSFDPELHAALTAIADHPSFANTLALLKTTLQGTMLGYDAARARAHSALTQTLQHRGTARSRFGQDLGVLDPINRKIERVLLNQQFIEWWRNERCTQPHAVLVGEEGSGKT